MNAGDREGDSEDDDDSYRSARPTKSQSEDYTRYQNRRLHL